MSTVTKTYTVTEALSRAEIERDPRVLDTVIRAARIRLLLTVRADGASIEGTPRVTQFWGRGGATKATAHTWIRVPRLLSSARVVRISVKGVK